MKYLLILFVILITSRFSVWAEDRLVVVVNINNPTNEITKKQLIDLYMGKYVAFPNGNFAIPLDLLKDSTERKSFYKNLTGRSISQINAYWSRIKFTGRASQPQKVDAEQAVSKVNHSSSTIVYIQESQVTNKMKVIYKIDQ